MNPGLSRVGFVSWRRSIPRAPLPPRINCERINALFADDDDDGSLFGARAFAFTRGTEVLRAPESSSSRARDGRGENQLAEETRDYSGRFASSSSSSSSCTIILGRRNIASIIGDLEINFADIIVDLILRQKIKISVPLSKANFSLFYFIFIYFHRVERVEPSPRRPPRPSRDAEIIRAGHTHNLDVSMLKQEISQQQLECFSLRR